MNKNLIVQEISNGDESAESFEKELFKTDNSKLSLFTPGMSKGLRICLGAIYLISEKLQHGKNST